MKHIPYKLMLFEAILITGFCAVFVGIFYSLNILPINNLVVLFIMLLISNVSVFSLMQKPISHSFFASFVVIGSIILGGLCGFYTPIWVEILTITGYTIGAFMLPKTRLQASVLQNGATMFLVFTFLNFNASTALKYVMFGIIISVLFILFHLILNKFHMKYQAIQVLPIHKAMSTLVVGISLIITWIILYFISHNTHFDRLYWIPLTVITIAQSTIQFQYIKIAFLRIVMNTIGSLIIIALLELIHIYIPIQYNILFNLGLLLISLFCIFALGFSYTLRTLFIALTVVGSTIVLTTNPQISNNYFTMAEERILFTLIGGSIVIVTTILLRLLYLKVYGKIRPREHLSI